MLKTPKRWTVEEDRVLLEKVSQLGNSEKAKDWTAIAEALPGRSNKDCRKRWYNQHIGGLKKGPWDPSEDERLRVGVEEYGDQWTLVAEEVGTRSADQCAKRWHHSLNPNLDQSKWSTDEDRTLLDAVRKRGRAWRQIQMEHFPHRASNNVKNRYVTLTRKRRSHSIGCAQQRGDKVAKCENTSDNGEETSSTLATSDGCPTPFDNAPSPPLFNNLAVKEVGQSPYWHSLLNLDQAADSTAAMLCDEIPSLADPMCLSSQTPMEFIDHLNTPLNHISEQPFGDPCSDESTPASTTSIFDRTFGAQFSPNVFASEAMAPETISSNSSCALGHRSTSFALTIDDPSPETITGVMNFLAHSGAKFKLEVR